jgi:hypothetical protein
MKTEKSVALHWVAEYADGSTKTEVDCNYSNLSRVGLVAFGLFDAKEKAVSMMQLGNGKVLFYRMRVTLDLSGHGSERIYLLGYRKANGEFNLTVVDSEGKTKNHNDFKTANLESIQFYEQEQV